MPADGRGRGVRWSVGVGSVAVAGSARLDAQGLGRDAGRSLYVMQVEVTRKSRATAHPRWRDVGVQGGSALPSVITYQRASPNARPLPQRPPSRRRLNPPDYRQLLQLAHLYQD